MLYELLYPLRNKAEWLNWLNVLALRAVPRHLRPRRRPWCSRSCSRRGSFASCSASKLAKSCATTAPSHALQKERHAHHGRRAHSPQRARAYHSVVRSAQQLRVGPPPPSPLGYGVIGYLDDYMKIRAKNTRGLPGRYKLHRPIRGRRRRARLRLVLGRRPHGHRLDRPARSHGSAIRCILQASHHGAGRVLSFAIAVLIVVWTSNAVNLTDGLDGLGHWSGHCQCWHLPGVGVPRGRHLRLAQRVAEVRGRQVLGHSVHGELGRAQRVLRGHGGRRYRLPLVQHLPRASVHGRRGRAVALGGGLGMCAVFTKNEALSLLLGGVFTLEGASVVIASHVVQAHGQAHIPHGAHSPPLRKARDGRSQK